MFSKLTLCPYHASSWEYLGEGKVHIICSYIGTETQIGVNNSAVNHDDNIISSLCIPHNCTVDGIFDDGTSCMTCGSAREKDAYSNINHVTDSLDSQMDSSLLSPLPPSHPIKYSNDSTALRDWPSLVLRLTKKYQSKEEVLRDELYLRNVMKPLFGHAIGSRSIVELSAAFLES